MADPDQMNRKELLIAKKRVELQLKRLSYNQIGRGGSPENHTKDDLIERLEDILVEINAELAEMDAKRA